MFPPAVASLRAVDVPAEATIIDVREDDEWAVGHIERAIHIPLSEFPSRFAELNPTDHFVVVCRSGHRSSYAVAWLEREGASAHNLLGGMNAWAAAGLPFVSETGAEPIVA